jgi:hypothetical protein
VYIASKTPGKYIKAKVLNTPINDDSETYTVQETISGDIREILAHELINHDPTDPPGDPPTSTPFPQYQWITHDAKAVIFLQNIMKHPQQGKLKYDTVSKE